MPIFPKPKHKKILLFWKDPEWEVINISTYLYLETLLKTAVLKGFGKMSYI